MGVPKWSSKLEFQLEVPTGSSNLVTSAGILNRKPINGQDITDLPLTAAKAIFDIPDFVTESEAEEQAVRI